jgi:hypothetical protein
MSTLLLELIQVPKRFATFEDNVMTADIANQCYRLSRDGVLDMYDPPTHILLVIRYFTAVFHFMAGRKAAWSKSFSYSKLIS